MFYLCQHSNQRKMSELKVENFGPITSGYNKNDGFMDFRKVTVFIGNQGAGKSSVAKLFSTCSWLEKALFQGKIAPKYAIDYNRFVNRYCAYQNLKNYFRDDTVVEYRGKYCTLIYRNKKLNIETNLDAQGYKVPQIMYVPAERNFLSAVDAPDKLKGLSQSLLTFWEELRLAQREAPANMALPIGNVRFEFDKTRKVSYIRNGTSNKISYRLKLSEASSGFQSYVPLLLVTRHLALSIHREQDASRSELSSEELRKRRIRIARIAQLLANERISEEVQQIALESLATRFQNETFLNIVEELEQNLFPKSQQIMLYQLLEFAGIMSGSSLVLTTHSPYVVNYLTLAIKAKEVMTEISKSGQFPMLQQKLERIVPEKAAVAGKDVIVYELDKMGRIKKLPMPDGLPSDENDLNEALGETNSQFSDLLEIEQSVR